MLEGQVRSFNYKGTVYDLRLSFGLDEFQAELSGAEVSDPRILAELFSVNRAALFGESLLDFRKGALLNNIASAENAAAHIDIVQQLERTYDSVISSAGVVTSLYGFYSGSASGLKTAAEIATEFSLFTANMAFDEAEGAAFDFLFDAILSSSKDLASEAYSTYLQIRDGGEVVDSTNVIQMARDAAIATNMSLDLSSLISSYDLENEGWLTLVKDLGLSVGSGLFEGWALGKTANNVVALDPLWDVAIRSADTLSTGLSLVDFSVGSVETIAQMELLIQSAKGRYEDQSLSFLSSEQIDEFETGFLALQITPNDLSDDYVDPDVSDDHSDSKDSATVLSVGTITNFTSLGGIVDSRIDVDVFEAQLQGGQKYSFLLWADTTQNSRLDPDLTINAPTGAVWRNDNLTNNTTMSFLSIVAPTSGTYDFEARGVGDSAGAYWLTITPISSDKTAENLQKTSGDTDSGNTSSWHWQGDSGNNSFPTPGWDPHKGNLDAANQLRGHDGDDRIEAGSGDDIVWGDDDNDYLYGEDGDDILRGGRQGDRLYGGDDDDLIYGERGDDRIWGDGTGSSSDNGDDTIYGGDGDDTIRGGPDDDYIKGEDDNDYIRGQEGDDELYGDRDDDDLFGDEGDDQLYGGPGNDELDGGDDRDRLAGEEGNDILDGGKGDDALYGGDDDDILEGKDGDDLLHGEDGIDTADFSGGRGGVVVNLFDEISVSSDLGQDILYSIENIIGSRGKDVIDGDHGPNVLDGGNEVDIIRGHNGNDTIFGGDEPDVLWGDEGDDIVHGDEDDDEIRGGLGSDQLFGGTEDDHLRGEQDNDFIDGGSGTDTAFFWGEREDFHIALNSFNELVVTDIRANDLEGTDKLINVEILEFFDGSALVADILAPAPIVSHDLAVVDANRVTFVDLLSNDTINATSAYYSDVTINSGVTSAFALSSTASPVRGKAAIVGGKAVFDPNGDFDHLIPGEKETVEISYELTTSGFQSASGTASVTVNGVAPANMASYFHSVSFVVADLLLPKINQGDAAGDVYIGIDDLQGTNFNDDLRGDNAANTIRGGKLNDTIHGRGGKDTLLGQDGNDVLLGYAEADDLNGGLGIDRAAYWTGAMAIRADLQFAHVNTGDAAGDSYSSIEDLQGTVLNDDLRGDNGDNTIWGNKGNDTIHGRNGNDTLNGQNGNDILLGYAGADGLNGGAGTDRAAYWTASAAIRADLQFAHVNTGDAAGDTYTSIENLQGSNHNDDLRGDNGDNVLWGNNGNDLIHGRNGNDTLNGQNGDDILLGYAGADDLNGGAGTDRVAYWTASAAIRADLQFAHLNTGDAAGDSYSSLEHLQGTVHNDDLRGDNGDNTIWGNNGNDTIHGRAGYDTLNGQNGNDILIGYAGGDDLDGGAGTDRAAYWTAGSAVTADLMNAAVNTGDAAGDTYTSIEDLQGSAHDDDLRGDAGGNMIWGGNGDDAIRGRGGNDTLLGQGGNDTFLFENGFGNDVIIGFEANNDAEDIDLSAVTAITDFTDLVNNHLFQVGANAVIDDLMGNAITLTNTVVGDLNSADFVF